MEKEEDSEIEEDDEDEESIIVDETDDIEECKKKELSYILVPDDERKTSNILQKFEYVAVVTARAHQIAGGGEIYISDISDCGTEIEIAKKEVSMRRCPLSVKRYIGTKNNTKYYEIWKVNELLLFY